jgi:hypothetical protein
VSREIRAWALEEKQGGRKGKLVTLDAAPSWYPIKTALYYTRNDAIRYIKNTQSEKKYNVVRVKVTVEKTSEDEQ